MDRAYTLLLILAVGATLLQATRTRQPLAQGRHIDGELADWRNYPLYHLDESPAVVGFSNQADYLSLQLSTRDPHLQRQIMAGSLRVWLNWPHRNRCRLRGVVLVGHSRLAGDQGRRC